MTATQAADATLLVRELVTNSVRHAQVDFEQSLTVEAEPVDDCLRVSVIDSGSLFEPRVIPADPGTPGGFGLLLVNKLAIAWGV